ncbi:MAG: PAS domain S-box protein, partial [Nitrospirota bacterium]
MPTLSYPQDLSIQQLRAVVAAADEFTQCPDVDSVFRSAVEFARNKLGLERSTIFMADEGFLRGTYGTDVRGKTTDEHNQQYRINALWSERLQALEALGVGWTTIQEMRFEWHEGQARPVGEGWIALTPMHSAQKLIGIFCNDTAISGSACDPNTQELVSVFCSLLGNIIERKRAENTLAEERNLMRTLIDSVPDYIYAKDTATHLILGNTALARLAGFTSPEPLIGQTVFDLFPHDLAQAYYLDDQMIMDSGQPLINREERTQDPDGNEIWLLTTKIPIRNSQGNVAGLVGVSRNITPLKQAQDALKISHEALEVRIQECIAELKQTNVTFQAEMKER